MQKANPLGWLFAFCINHQQMFSKALFVCLVCLLTSLQLLSQKPKVLLLDGAQLVTLKARSKTDNTIQEQVQNIKSEADTLLNMKPVSVMDKAFTPASGNKHDYMSQAPYYWYDSSKPKGLPYIRRDGVRNPEILKITDRKNIGELENATRVLSFAYYFTGEEKYAAKASEFLKHWFLNDNTKMNPNLDYAQAIPGVNDGRGIGIIETIALTGIADASVMLKGSKSWSSKDDKALKQWYNKYLKWMQMSKNGIDEMQAENNHGTFYDMQVVDFALFTGRKKTALKTLSHTKKRMEVQIDSEGKMPLELERTQSLWYSTYNLEGWFKLATLAEKAGVDLWNYTGKNKGSIRKAIDWLAPYAVGEKQWPYEQIGEYKKENIYILLVQAAQKFKGKKYVELVDRLNVKLKDPLSVLLYSQN
jgi:hypothetical protein